MNTQYCTVLYCVYTTIADSKESHSIYTFYRNEHTHTHSMYYTEQWKHRSVTCSKSPWPEVKSDWLVKSTHYEKSAMNAHVLQRILLYWTLRLEPQNKWSLLHGYWSTHKSTNTHDFAPPNAASPILCQLLLYPLHPYHHFHGAVAESALTHVSGIIWHLSRVLFHWNPGHQLHTSCFTQLCNLHLLSRHVRDTNERPVAPAVSIL